MQRRSEQTQRACSPAPFLFRSPWLPLQAPHSPQPKPFFPGFLGPRFLRQNHTNHFGMWMPKSFPLLLAAGRAEISSMGERSAVRPQSGKTVRQSVPALRRPTPPSTAGRKPAARSPVQFLRVAVHEDDSGPSETAGTQRKTGRGAGQSPAIQSRRQAPGSFTGTIQSSPCLPYSPDDSQISSLIQFFETLNRWERELHFSNSNPIEVNS